jgi:hypothetical protein
LGDIACSNAIVYSGAVVRTLAGENPRLRWKGKGKTGGNALGVGKAKRGKLQRAKRTAEERGAVVTGKALLPGERATVFMIAVMSALCDSAIPALCVSSVAGAEKKKVGPAKGNFHACAISNL